VLGTVALGAVAVVLGGVLVQLLAR